MTTVRITIPFHDKPLVLIDHNEQPFVAMRPIVDGMGMDWGSQRRKLQKRFASTVVILTTVADDGRKRAMLCLPLKQLPAWLNTIPFASPAHRDNMRHIAELFVAELTGAEAMLQALLEALAAGEAPETVLLEAAQSVNRHRDDISAMLDALQNQIGEARHDLH